MVENTFEEMDLKWDDFYWLGYSKFNEGTEIHVCTKDEEEISPHPSQLATWLQFTESFELIFPKILEAVFNYYTTMRPRYLSMGTEFIEHMPVLENAKQIENMITLNHICVSWPYEEGSVQLGLNFSCKWEREHGLGVVIEGHSIKKIGGADCAIL